MTAEIILQRGPEEIALERRRAELAEARVQLAELETELGQLRAELAAFESRYMRQVGVLYAELDSIEVRITEREVDLYDSDAARERAEEARRRAAESHEAAFGVEEAAAEFDPPPNLKALFREVAKRIHPDLARDEAEQRFLHTLMARANQAYRRGHTEVLQQLLDDHLEVRAAGNGDDAAAEAFRVARQIQHARRELAQMEAERDALLGSEIAHLYVEAEAAGREYRDLLTELAARVQEQIIEAQSRFEFVDRQVSAHGR